MADAAGEVKILLTLDGVSYSTGMAKAQAQARQFQNSMTSAAGVTRAEMAEARGTVMVLGEEIGVHLPRHVQRFIASLPGVATALSGAFSTVAIVAIGVAAFEAGKKIYEFAEKNEEAARKNAEAWREVEGSMQATNDDLQVANDRLEMAIAKLEHKPENGLKLAIDEAIQSADTLGEKLNADAQKLAQTLEAQQPGVLARFFGTATDTSDVTKRSRGLQTDLDAIDSEGRSRLIALRKQGASQTAIDAATADLAAKRKAHIDKEITDWAEPQLAAAQRERTREVGTGGPAGTHGGPDIQARLAILTNYVAALGRESGFIGLSQTQGKLKGDEAQAESAHDAAELAAKAWAAELAKMRESAPGKIRAMVDSSKDDREYRKKVFDAQREGVAPPDDLDRNIGAEMESGPADRWKLYNEQVAKAAEGAAKLQAELALTMVAIDAESGSITKHAAAVQRAAIHDTEFAASLAAMQRQLNSVIADPALTQYERDTQAWGLREQMSGLWGSHETQSSQDQAAIRATSTLGEFSDKIRETIQQFTDLGDVFANFTNHTAESINDALIHALSTPQNELRGKHLFRHVGAGIAEDAGGTALRFGEGEILKALIGPGKQPLGSSPLNALWVRLVNSLPFGGNGFLGSASGLGAGSIATSGAGGGGFNIPGIGSAGGALGGWLGGLNGVSAADMAAASTTVLNAAQFAPAAAGLLGTTSLDLGGLAGFAGGGMIPNNMPVMVGERGIEVIAGAGGRHVIPNHALGGHVEIHNHIDARGATDPEAVNAAAHRAIASWAPHMPDMARAAVRNHNSRMPSGRRI